MAITVTSTDQTRLALQTAGAGSRILAYLIDFALKGAFMLLVVMVGSLVQPLLAQKVAALELRTQAVVLVIVMALQWGYFWFFDWVCDGQTPGKRAVGIRVVRRDGGSIGLVEATLRNIIRYVDWPGIGVVLFFVTERCWRLGDLAAGTLVVYEREDVLDDLEGRPAADGEQGQTVRMSTAEYECLTELMRRQSLTPQARAILTRRFAERLRDRVGAPGGQTDDEWVLRAAWRRAAVGRRRAG